MGRNRKKKQRKQRTSSGAARSQPANPTPGRRPLSRARIRRRLHLAAGVLLVLAVVGGLWWLSHARQDDFLALADRGREGLAAQVVTEPSAGRGHVSARVRYSHRFPTSGAHNPTWVAPGVYGERQRTERLVHALEHGNIVIYYDQPAAEVMDRLRRWAALYDNQWSGIVVTPAAGLDEAIVLTAWTRRLRLGQFDPAVAAAFIDAYRGRGPENPVR